MATGFAGALTVFLAVANATSWRKLFQLKCCSVTVPSSNVTVRPSTSDLPVKEAFLSWKSFRQLLSLKSAQAVKSEPKPAVMASPNGPPAVLATK